METSNQTRSRISTSSRIDRANAPGKRGPTPTSCAGCRRVRSKCFRKSGGKVGEETCVGCLRRGIECKLPHEISQYRKVGSITNCAERSLVAFEVSAELVTGLFDVRLKPGRGGYAVCHMTRFALDLETMEDKFHSVGRKLQQLDRTDQLNLRVIWAKFAQRNALIDKNLSPDRVALFIRSAQSNTDSSAIWRTPTLANFSNLFLLYLVLSIEGRPEAEHYFTAASSHFRRLFRTASDLVGKDRKPVWFAFRFAIIDSQLALENGTAPLLSPRDSSVFFPASTETFFNLPPVNVQAIANSQPLPLLVDLCIPAVRYYLLVAQPLAHYFAQPTPLLDAAKDSEKVQWGWGKIDIFDEWVVGTIRVLRSKSGLTASQKLALSTLSYIYTLALVLECSTLEYLARRFEFLSTSIDLVSLSPGLDDLSTVASLYAKSTARYEMLVCRFLRFTRNADQVYQLGTSAGFSISAERLHTLATIFCRASVENDILFPQGLLDKLASTTFLLDTIKGNFHESKMQESIHLLKDLQVQLERTCGYTGNEALYLIVSSRPQVPNVVPDGIELSRWLLQN